MNYQSSKDYFNNLIKDFSDSQLRVGEVISRYEARTPINVSYEPTEDNITMFKCSECGKWNNYWTHLCSECDYKASMQEDERQQNGDY